MSLNLSITNLGVASLMKMQKSVNLEKMEDKDIVKRAFKTFQNNSNQSNLSDEDGFSVNKQVSTRGTETGILTPINIGKENGRPTKVNNVDKKDAVSVRTNFGLKSDMRAEKREEKLEETSSANDAERTCLHSKSQEEKDAELRKLRKNLNFKPITIPGLYQKQKTSKSTSLPESLGTGTHR